MYQPKVLSTFAQGFKQEDQDMKQTVHIKSISDFVEGNTEDIRRKINCMEVNVNGVDRHLSTPVFFKAAVCILVLSGTARANINHKQHPVDARTTLVLSASHLFYFEDYSTDFNCLCLLVGKEFMEDMDSTDMIYKRIRYGVKLYNNPILAMSDADFSLLTARITAIDQAISNTTHRHYKDMILNTLFAFYLDLSNIIDQRSECNDDPNLTRHESIIKSFIELLTEHYRQEHKVDFYASKLNLSTHYLTLIVKRITGQSVCDFIFEMLYSDARNLLTCSQLSIQEITATLHFSDQSSFGKFFKRRAGISPIDYRKEKEVR